jgi:hypothetical protein
VRQSKNSWLNEMTQEIKKKKKETPQIKKKKKKKKKKKRANYERTRRT